MADLQNEIDELSINGITHRDLRKIYEKQVLGEDIVAEGFSPIATLLWEQAIDGYAAAINVLTDVNPELEKDRFSRAQRDAARFRDMLKWVNEAIHEGKVAAAKIAKLEENGEIEENFDDNRQSRYPDD